MEEVSIGIHTGLGDAKEHDRRLLINLRSHVHATRIIVNPLPASLTC